MKHDWIKSTLGHGETMCRRCGMTNREAAVLGYLDECDGSTQPETEVIPNQRPEQVNRKPRSADKTQPGAATGESQTAPGDVMSEDVLKAISFLRNDAYGCAWIAELIERLARERNCYRNDAMRDRSRLRKAEAALAQAREDLAKADAVCNAIKIDAMGGLYDGDHGQHFLEACARHAARQAAKTMAGNDA